MSPCSHYFVSGHFSTCVHTFGSNIGLQLKPLEVNTSAWLYPCGQRQGKPEHLMSHFKACE